MLTDEELRFIEKELRKNGVLFESAQNLLDTDPKKIYELCCGIQDEECELSGGGGIDENGNWYYYDDKEGYDPVRANMAEDICHGLYETIYGGFKWGE